MPDPQRENIDTILETGNKTLISNQSILQGYIKDQAVVGNTATTWNPRSGGTSKLIVKGTANQVFPIAEECQRKGYEYTLTDGAVFTIEITFPVDILVNSLDNEPEPISFWELNFHQVDRSVLELNDKSFITSLDPSSVTNIELKINTKNAQQSVLGATDILENIVNATLAYNLKLVGIEGKAQFVPSLKRNAIISNKYDLSQISSWTNSQYDASVMSTEDLLARYNSEVNELSKMPTFIENQLPTSLKSYDVYDDADGQAEGGSIAQRLGFVTSKKGVVTYIGWLQYPVESQQVAINKVQVSQTWVFNQWSAGKFGLYDVYIGSSNTPADGPDPTAVILGSLPQNQFQ